MRRCGSLSFAWLVALILVVSPLLTASPLIASAQVATEQADSPVDEGAPTGESTLPVETESPLPTATIEEPVATETVTATPSDTATELPASPESPTTEPTTAASPSEKVTATVEPTEPTISEPVESATADPTATPQATKAVKPTATPKPTTAAVSTPDEGEFSSAQVSDLEIALNCTGNPETIRVRNIGAADILLKGIATYLDSIEAEPFAISRLLSPGETAIFQAGNAALYGTVLSTRFIFTNSGYDDEGVRISTSVGMATRMCAPRPLPPVANLIDLKVTVDCLSTAETIRVSNNGAGWATIKGLATYVDPIADEPFATNRVLKPGQTAIFQAGEGAKYGTVLTSQYIFTNSAYEKDGIRVSTSVGKLSKACAPKPVPPEKWLEVNLSTQYLIARVGNTVVNQTYVSTGKPGFNTPTGTYYVMYRYRTQTMSGCIQGECYYVPDVPWVQYFTNYGHALHGAYWHNDFGRTRSHGCINLPLWFAEWLWYWATYGTRLWIHY